MAAITSRYFVNVSSTTCSVGIAFGLSENGLLDSKLVSGQELTEAELRSLKKAAGLDKAYGNALRYAAMRPRSEPPKPRLRLVRSQETR